MEIEIHLISGNLIYYNNIVILFETYIVKRIGNGIAGIG